MTPRFPVACLALSLVAASLPLAAQVDVNRQAPLRFSVAWAHGSPQGDFARVTEPPRGFAAWLSLPLTRESTLGLRAEFSVLSMPKLEVTVPGGDDQHLTVTVRGTVGFTGVGPRVEVGLGPLALSAAFLAGYTRVITDATGQLVTDEVESSVAVSASDYAFAGKMSADAYLPLLRGIGGTAVALTGGIDYSTGGAAAFPRSDSFRVEGPGEVAFDRPSVRPAMLTVRTGVSVEF